MPPGVSSLVSFPSLSHGASRPDLLCPFPQELVPFPGCFAALTSATLGTFASAAPVASHRNLPWVTSCTDELKSSLGLEEH